MTVFPPWSSRSSSSSGKNRAGKTQGFPAVSQGGDLLRLGAPELHQGLDAFPLQKRLIADQEHGGGAASQGFQSQADGVADTPIRVLVPDGGEAKPLR